jgi:hypothetical protein
MRPTRRNRSNVPARQLLAAAPPALRAWAKTVDLDAVVGRALIRSECDTTSPLFDAEGRRYSVSYRVVRTAMDGAGPLVTSNLPHTFHADKSYPPALQARDLSSPAEATKITKIAQNLDPDRVLLPHGDPTLGAPVVWPGPDGRLYVLGGNGRTIAILMAPPDRVSSYNKALSRRWPSLAPVEPAPEGWRDVLVRVVSWPDGRELSLAEATMLAGASQESTAAAETPLGRALSVVRALGITDPSVLPPIDWSQPVTLDNIGEFQERNGAFWRSLMGRMDPARRDAVSQAPKAVELVKQVMVGFLPPGVRASGFGDEATEEALLAALPLLVSLEGQIAAGTVDAKWSLLRVLPEAVHMYRALQKRRIPISKAVELLEREAEQGRIGETETLLSGISLLGFYLGVMLYRSSRLKDPSEGVSVVLKPYYFSALKDHPGQGGMFGAAAPSDPAGALATALGLRLPTKLPPGVRRNGRALRRNGARDAGQDAVRQLLVFVEPGPVFVNVPVPDAVDYAIRFGLVKVLPRSRTDGALWRIQLTQRGRAYLGAARQREDIAESRRQKSLF